MDQVQKENNSSTSREKETLKVLCLSLVWLVFFALSFFSYYAIPVVIFVSWAIIAWLIKALKKDKKGGSGYDQDF